MTDGSDKPYKYPLAFEKADIIVLNKIDLLPYVDFDEEFFMKGIRHLNKTAPVFKVSGKTGEGFAEAAAWLNKDKLIGFARVISDYATTYYLSDVIIDIEYQHKGLGTALISYINSLPEFSGLRGVLITRDAQALYRKFGFEVMNDRAMVKEPNR